MTSNTHSTVADSQERIEPNERSAGRADKILRIENSQNSGMKNNQDQDFDPKFNNTNEEANNISEPEMAIEAEDFEEEQDLADEVGSPQRCHDEEFAQEEEQN